MLTNVVAAVTVFTVTNITEILPQHSVIDPSPVGPNGEVYAVYNFHFENDKDPKEKWVKTEIAEIHELTFDFDSYHCKQVYKVVKTNWSEHYEKLDSWKKSTNNVPSP